MKLQVTIMFLRCNWQVRKKIDLVFQSSFFVNYKYQKPYGIFLRVFLCKTELRSFKCKAVNKTGKIDMAYLMLMMF